MPAQGRLDSGPDPAAYDLDEEHPLVSPIRRELSTLIRDPEASLESPDPGVRRLAVATAGARPTLHHRIVDMLASDIDATVRRECAEVLGGASGSAVEPLLAALDDPEPSVREAAAFALGEIGATESVTRLIEVATDEDDESPVREAAVAGLGAIGDEAAVPVLLDLIATGPPQVRRRCVPALTVFDAPGIEPALRRAATDRNPMVREAAEMVVGRAAH